MLTGTINNGEPIIKIERKGRVKVQIGDGPTFIIDVIDCFNRWSELDRSFREEAGEDKKLQIQVGRVGEWYTAAWNFVQGEIITGNTARKEPAADLNTESIGKWGMPDLTLTEALEFTKTVLDEGNKLFPFIVPATPNAPSSPERITIRHSSE